MSIRTLIFGGGLAAVAACSAGTETEKVGANSSPASPVSTTDSAAALLPKVTVLFFGTSLTAGYGLDPAIAFPNQVADLAKADGLPITAVNAGLSGETSAGAVRRIDWTLRNPVDVVVLETGGNDALRALNADSLGKNLTALVQKTKAAQPTARVVLAVMEAPPNLGASYTSRFRQAYVNAAREQGVQLLPFLLEGVAGHDTLNQADGVHPNERGERIVAENVWKALKPVVEEAYRAKKSG